MPPKKEPAGSRISKISFIPKDFIMSSGRILFSVVAAPAAALTVAIFGVGLVKTAVELVRD
ncbi:hypothetical protein [Polaromonas sp. CG_9.11]|uniref:hypothetical protein n=1 Tax=Polaromonas sp. CG_9.11 TaxID=2787730 RepID=UPI0018CAD5D0|nr:hypothetical protein [Polaromonas sp. CG_9.11]MBG6077060.1 hypothetical protein [Polaromonas sp. CG_9.11]